MRKQLLQAQKKEQTELLELITRPQQTTINVSPVITVAQNINTLKTSDELNSKKDLENLVGMV